jgi:orotate phosphoribosyltransferase
MKSDREYLRRLIEERCLIEGDFTLSTGARSRFYFDCKAITLNAEGLALVSQAFLEEIAKFPVQPNAIGGMTLGADFLTAGVIVLSHLKGGTLRDGSIVRKEPKKHGTKNKIENQLAPGSRIVVVDDVITTGSSTLAACEEFVRAGYEIVGVLAVVDREGGGREKIEEKYGKVVSLFRKSDFPSLAAFASTPVDTKQAAA